MIDIHCHILPDLDDGAKDWQETLDMCAIARDDGIHTIVATPHVKQGMYTPAKELILSKVAELNTLLLAPRSSHLVPHALTILPGADNAFEPDILKQIEEGTALCLAHPMNPTNAINATNPTNPMNAINPINANNATNLFRYVLLELPDYFLFPQVKDLIRRLREKNIVPVLSHPERIAMIQRNHKLLHEFIQAGALSQVTAMSITGEFGKEIKKLTRTLVKKNLAHVIATDAHSRDRRPPILSRAVAEATTLIGKDRAEMMVKKIPQAIIEGRKIEIENS